MYTKLSKFDPVFNYMLFERNLLSPYSFDKPVVAMSIASHGELIAFAHPEESESMIESVVIYRLLYQR